MAAMHAKASVLLGEATAIAASYEAGAPPCFYLIFQMRVLIN